MREAEVTKFIKKLIDCKVHEDIVNNWVRKTANWLEAANSPKCGTCVNLPPMGNSRCLLGRLMEEHAHYGGCIGYAREVGSDDEGARYEPPERGYSLSPSAPVKVSTPR